MKDESVFVNARVRALFHLLRGTTVFACIVLLILAIDVYIFGWFMRALSGSTVVEFAGIVGLGLLFLGNIEILSALTLKAFLPGAQREAKILFGPDPPPPPPVPPVPD